MKKYLFIILLLLTSLNVQASLNTKQVLPCGSYDHNQIACEINNSSTINRDEFCDSWAPITNLNWQPFWWSVLGNTIYCKYSSYAGNQIFKTLALPGQTCPANSTLGGGVCTCNSGYQDNATLTACEPVPPSCVNGAISSAGYYDVGVNDGTLPTGTLPAIGVCDGTCSVYWTGTNTYYRGTIGGVDHWFWLGAYEKNGATCSAADAPSPSAASPATPPAPCPAGQLHNLEGVCSDYVITCPDGSQISFDQSCPTPPLVCTPPLVPDALGNICISPPDPTPATCPAGQTAVGTGTGSYCVDSANPCIAAGTCSQTVDGTGEGIPGEGTGTGDGTGAGPGSPGGGPGVGENPGPATSGVPPSALLPASGVGEGWTKEYSDFDLPDSYRVVDVPGMGNTFRNILLWTLPAHNSTCPQPQIDLSSVLGVGRVYALSAHCQIAQDHFPTLQAAMIAVWTISAMFIVLKA